jgi:putative transposase
MEIADDLGRFRFVIRDRDTKFTAVFDAVFAAEAMQVLITPVRAPRANAYADRWVGTVRREVLDRLLIVGCRQLRLVSAEYADHYNVHRPHRALGQLPPLGPGEPAVVAPAGRVVRRDRLGGLIHEYAQVACGDRISGTHKVPRPAELQDPGLVWDLQREGLLGDLAALDPRQAPLRRFAARPCI